MANNNKYEDPAVIFCNAIEIIASDPAALENLKSYLINHFDIWLKKYASTPADLSAEMWNFANIYKLAEMFPNS